MPFSVLSYWLFADERHAQRVTCASRLRVRLEYLALLPLILLLCSCSAPEARAMDGAREPAPPRLVTVEVAVTVEVTRETVTERIVPATPQPPEPCAPKGLAEAEEVVVAVLMPLSQSSSLANTIAAQSALVLAAAGINQSGGVVNTPIELWWADTANLPEQGRQRAEEAILQHCAVAMIGSNNSVTAAAIDGVAQRNGVPHLIIDGADVELTASESPTLFRLTANNAMVATMHRDWLAAVGDYNNDGALTAAIIVENSTFQVNMAETLRAAFVDAGIATDVYTVELPSADFSSLVARIVVKDTLPDVLFVRVNGSATSFMLQQLIGNGVGPTRKSLLVASWLPDEDDPFWGAVGAEGVGIVSPRVGAWQGMTGEAAADLLNGYGRLFGRWPDGAAFAGYDALMLLADAIRRAPSLEGAALIAALESSDVELANGRYGFAVTSRTRVSSDAPDWAWHQWLDLPMLFLQRTAEGTEIVWPPQYATIPDAFVRPSE